MFVLLLRLMFYRINDTPYQPCISLNKHGSVLTAHCNCMAGLGETCSHVAAVLYKLEAAARLGIISQTPTDLPCQWNQNFTKKIEPSQISNIDFYSTEAKKKVTNKFKHNHLEPTSIAKSNFLEAIRKINANVVGLSLFPGMSNAFLQHSENNVPVKKLPKQLRNLYMSHSIDFDHATLLAECNKIKTSFVITTDEIIYLESVTRNQSASIVWHQQRAGRITGSVAHSVLQSNICIPAKSVVLKITMPVLKNNNVPSLKWGREKGEEALMDYQNSSFDPEYVSESFCLNSKNMHNHFELKNTGLVIKPDKFYLGVSADAVVKCSCCGTGIVEVKCPYSLREKGLHDIILSNAFYLTYENGEKNHEYYCQVQHENYVCEVEYCDFVVWTPIEFVVLGTYKDTLFINDMIKKQEIFWENVILPELLTRKLKLSCSNIHQNNSSIMSQFCICNGPEDGSMVGCDCCNQWYYIKCLNLKKLPTSKTWYCKKCLKKKKGL
nr:uncharacterized protein LOC124814271 [Hydra vulgaris]